MKVGFFGGLLLLGLTIIFSMIAIQNNKIAREVVVKSFNLNQKESKDVAKESKDKNATLKNLATKKDKVTNEASIKQDKGFMDMDDFDKKFADFDKQFNNF